MVQTIEKPTVPFVGPIKGGLDPGTMIRIQGQVPSDGDRFNINLHCGSPPSDIALHVSVRLLQSYIARNSFEDGEWGKEEDSGNLTIAPGEHFEILILCDPTSYKIAVNGNHFGEFQHRIPFNGVSHLKIDGTVAIGLIAFESAMPPPPPPQRMGEGGEMPPGYAPPPPPRDNFGYGPPPPQGPFGGGPGRYPHQRGEDGESGGFDSFLGNAGSAIAGVMVSGLAENLLGGLTGQSQRHHPSSQPQNPMYNDGGHHRQGGGSIIDDLLGSLTGGGSQSHQQRPPQSHSPMYNQGGQQQQQQGGSTISGMPNQPFGGAGSIPIDQFSLANQIPFGALPQQTNVPPPLSNQIPFLALSQQTNVQPPLPNQIPFVALPQQTNVQPPLPNQIPFVALPQQTNVQPPLPNQIPFVALSQQSNGQRLPPNQIPFVPPPQETPEQIASYVQQMLPPHLQHLAQHLPKDLPPEPNMNPTYLPSGSSFPHRRPKPPLYIDAKKKFGK